MSRLIKGIALAFFATVLPCLGWAVLPEPAWTWDGIGGTKQSETIQSGAPIYLVNSKVYNLGKYNIPSNNFTFSFWAKYQKIANWKSYIGFANSEGYVEFQDNQKGSLEGYGTGFDNNNRPLINLNASAYSLVTIVSDNGAGRIYINGAESKTFTVPTWASSEKAMTYFALGGGSDIGGGLTQNRACDTYLADVRVYDVALTAEQVGELYAGEYTNTSLQADSDEMVFGNPEETAGDPTAARLSERSARDIASTAFNSGIEGITATAQKYTKPLTSGGEYTRTLLTYTNTTENDIEIPGLTVDDADVFKGIAVGSIEQRGNTDGAVLTAETSDGAQTWFAVEHPFTRYTLSAGDHLRKALSLPAKTTYTIDDLNNISKPSSNINAVGMGVLYIPITVKEDQTSVTLTLKYSDGSWGAIFGTVDVYDADGFYVTTIEKEPHTTPGEDTEKGIYTVTISGLTPGATYLLAVQSGASYDTHNQGWKESNGNITLTNATSVDLADYTLFLDKTVSEDAYTKIEPTLSTKDRYAYDHDDIGTKYLDVPVLITDSTATFTVDHTSGNHRVEIGGLELLKNGESICSITKEEEAFSGGQDKNNSFEVSGLDAYLNQTVTARFNIWIDNTLPNHYGQIICGNGASVVEVSYKQTTEQKDLSNKYLDVPLTITATTLQLTVDYVSGNHRVEIGGLDLYTEKGVLVESIVQTGYSGGKKENNVFDVTLDSTYVGNVLIARFKLWVDDNNPSHVGKIICSGAIPTTGYLPKGCLVPKKTTYTNDDVENVLKSSPTVYAHGIFDVAVKINATTFSATMQYIDGNARAEIYNVELIDPLTGELIATATPSVGSYSGFNTAKTKTDTCYTGTNHAPTHSFTVDEALVGTTALVRFYVGREHHTTNTSRGNISATGATIVATVCPTTSPVTGVVPLEEKTLAPGESISFSYVTGKATDPEQFRRVYNEYLNAERAHPHRVLPHYNSWYDLCINRNGNAVAGRFTEDEALASMQAFRKELWEKRGVSIDSYLWDDGWDEWYSFWDFNANFPQGFTNLADEAHKVPGASIAAWLSPLGGYGASNTQRVKYVTDQGYSYSLADDVFYAAFRDRVIQMITDYDMNLFKFDRMGTGGDATAVADGYNPQLTAVGNLCAEMRVAKPDVFINATVGTWASPYWLMWADSIWRGGNDVGHEGSGSSRQKWITYRDNKMYDRIVAPGNLLPLNSMMMHGIVVCPSTGTTVDLQASTSTTVDFASEVWMGMTLGTGLQEYYITPSLMTDTWWDILAEGVKYVKANEAIFTDAHWIGGDPSVGIYGYASLGDRKGIITLRNPTSGTLTIEDSLDDWLEMPSALKNRGFTTKMIYNSTAEYDNAADTTDDFAIPDAVTAADATTATSATWSLPAYATVVFEVNFENTNEVVIDANTYASVSEWQEANPGVEILAQNVILDFGNITEAKTFTFDDELSTMGKLYIVGEQTAQATVAVGNSGSVSAMGGTSIETSITTSATALNAFMLSPSITSGVVVTVDVPEAATLSVTPTGSGEWVKTGAGTLTLTGAFYGGIYTTAITIEQGKVIVSEASQFVEMVAVDLGATLTVDAETTFSGLLAMNGTMEVNVATTLDGNLSVSSFATIGGEATITQNCNVQVSKGASLLVNNPITLGKTITKSGLGAIAYYGAISGNYGLTVNAGTVTLTGTNTYTGKTTIAAGATLVANPTATGESAKVFKDLNEVEVDGTLEIRKGLHYAKLFGSGDIAVTGSATIGIASGSVTASGIQNFSGTLSVANNVTLGLPNWSGNSGADYTLSGCDLVVDGQLSGGGNKGVAITVASNKTLSGSGEIVPNVTLASGATIDAQEGAVTVTGTVALPTGTLNVKLAEAPTVTAPAVILGKSGLDVGDVADTTTLALTIGETAGVTGYKLVATTAGYAVAADTSVVTDETSLRSAIAAVTGDTTLTLGNAITLDATLVIDIGATNTLTLDLAGNNLTSSADPVIKVLSGKLELISSTGTNAFVWATAGTLDEEAGIYTATNTAIVVDSKSEDATAAALAIGENVSVSTLPGEEVAVDLILGTLSSQGTIAGGLAIGNGSVVDASEGIITLTGEYAKVFLPTVTSLATGYINVILPADTTGFPALFVTCIGANETDANSVALRAKLADAESYSLNDKVHVMTDITTGAAIGYGVMQYVWVARDNNYYTTIAEALAAGETDITQFENTTEYVTVPEGVLVNSQGYTINGNVTVQNGGKYTSFGTINGNLTLESGATLDVSLEFDWEGTEYESIYTFTVTGEVTFPTGGDLTIVVGSSANTVDLGEPRQMIVSETLLNPGTEYEFSKLTVKTGKETVNADTKIVATSYTYELVTKTEGPCTFDGVDYDDSIQQALDAYYTNSNQTITLNEPAVLDQTIVVNVGEGNTVTMDLNGLNLTSTANPAIRIQSGNLALVNSSETPVTVSNNGTTILVGAVEAGTASDTACGLFIGEKVTVSTTAAKTVDVINGGISGKGKISGNLTLANGAMIDATHGVLTMAEGSTITFPAKVAGKGVDKDGKEVTYYTNNTIQVMTLAGSTYPSLFINCPAAELEAVEHTNVEVVIDGMEVTSEDFTLEVQFDEDQLTEVGYSVDGDGYAALAVVGDEMTPHKEFANAVAKAGPDGTVILLQQVEIVADLETNIYTGGQNVIISGEHSFTGTLTVAHGTTITANDALKATKIVVEPNATVTFGGIFTPENPIEISGTVNGTATINTKFILKDGACIAGTFSPTGGTDVEAGATVSITGTLNGDLLVDNATITGDGTINIGASNTLTGAGTILPTVNLANDATINKVGYEANHLVMPALSLTAEGDETPVINVEASTLANVINTKTTAISADNFKVTKVGEGYELYSSQTEQGDNTIVLPVVTKNNAGDWVLGLTKMNLVLNGVNIGGDLGTGLATYGYQHGFLEVKGIYNPNTFQLFSGVSMTGFTSSGYAIIDEDSFDFGIETLTIVIDGTDKKQILVTATVIAANGNERIVDYRTGTKVVVTDENGTAITGAVEITVGNDGNATNYGLTITEIPVGVKYLIVPYDDIFNGATGPSITKQFKVKATNESQQAQ